MAQSNGKVALVRSNLLLPTGCPVGQASVVDLVGYGTAACVEGTGATGGLSTTTAALRKNNGCIDTNQNAADFDVGAPNPRTTANNFDCNAPTLTATISPGVVCNESSATITATVVPGSSPASTTLTVTANLLPIGGSNPSANFTPGAGNTFTLSVSPTASTPSGSKNLVVTVTDNLNRSSTTIVTLLTAPCVNSASTVVISQIYGGGGNTGGGGATFTHDFVELFNRSGAPVNVTGWSVQYASSTDGSGGFGSGNPATNVPVALSGTIPPGGYYLVQLATGGAVGVALPTPDATGAVNIGVGDGRIALVNNSAALGVLGSSCTSASIVDLVGYGSAICFEGDSSIGAAPSPSNTTALFRALGGCQDTDRNLIDLAAAAVAPRNSSSPTNNCAPAPLGACCYYDGNTQLLIDCQNKTEAQCVPIGTTLTEFRAGQMCNQNPCLPAVAGACCAGNGTCSVASPPSACVGVFQGNFTTCASNPCPAPSGVCCRGSTCVVDPALQSQAACAASITGAATAGGKFVAAGPCGGTNHLTPCCYADYNQNGTRNVTDIFSFLTDWFAQRPWAIPGGNGTGTPAVGNIFSFLTDWFAGGCG